MARIVETKEIEMKTLTLGRAQARVSNVGAEIDELARSIKKQGQLQPIVVCPGEQDGTWEILMGQRRFLACQELGYKTIRASIIDEKINKTEALILSLTENLVRLDLNRKDAIDACTALWKRYGSIKDVVEETGISENKVREYIKYDRLDDSLKELVDNNEVDVKTALKAQDAADAVDGDVDEAIKLAKEMSGMSGVQRSKLVDTLKEHPESDVDDAIESSKGSQRVTSITVVLGHKANKALDSYADDEGQSKGEAAKEILEAGLKGSGYMNEGA